MMGRQAVRTILVLLIAMPVTPAFAEETSSTVLLQEIQEQLALIKEWIVDVLEDYEAEDWEPPEELDRNVTLELAVEEEDDVFSVTTATSHYMLHAHWSSRSEALRGPEEEQSTTEFALEIQGTVSEAESEEALLVSCVGSFEILETGYVVPEVNREESALRFESSAMFESGEKRVIASMGDLKLTMTVTAEP